MVHSCCWEVAWNVLGRPPLKNPGLSHFTGHLVYLRPFAHKTPFDCKTNDVDHELWAETPSHARIESGGEQKTRGVLPSMIQAAFSWLDRNPGVIRKPIPSFLSHQRDSLPAGDRQEYGCQASFTESTTKLEI